MAKPSFIYAFDNLGPDKFTELCNLLLSSKFRGYCAGGVGSDGGVDGELDVNLGFWIPEQESPIINTIIPKNKKVIFQFKHKTTARVGQTQSRQQLINLYDNQQSELDKPLLNSDDIYAYVLVTNVEVNSKFRNKFVTICKNKNNKIKHYQIIGLDDLETWVTMESQIRHMFFPTIFGIPRYDLKINILRNHTYQTNDLDNEIKLFTVNVLNVGTVTSYISHIYMRAIKNEKSNYFQLVEVPGRGGIDSLNPKFGAPLKPGRKHSFNYYFSVISDLINDGEIPVEIDVSDEIGNHYTEEIDYDFRQNI